MDTQKFIEGITADNLNKKVLQITPVLEKGIVNKIFIIDTGDEKFVVRLNNIDSFDQFKKEQWCIEQSTQKGVLGPKVLHLGTKDNLVFMIQTFIKGKHINNFSKDKISIWRKLGNFAVLIHQIQTKGFGNHMIKPGIFDGSWEKFLEYNIDSLIENDVLIKEGILTRNQSLRVKELFRTLQNKQFKFALNHGDISLKNTLVGENNVVFLLDWGSSESHIIPHFDLIEIIKSSFNLNKSDLYFRAFIEGYGMSEDEFDKILPEIKILMLLRAIDKLRWAIDRKPGKIDHYRNYLLEIRDFALS